MFLFVCFWTIVLTSFLVFLSSVAIFFIHSSIDVGCFSGCDMLFGRFLISAWFFPIWVMLYYIYAFWYGIMYF
jgi:hypothetical protein